MLKLAFPTGVTVTLDLYKLILRILQLALLKKKLELIIFT